MRRGCASPCDCSAFVSVAARADERDCELAREDLVIGETLARRVGRQQAAFGLRRMDSANGAVPWRPAAPLAQRRADPVRQHREAVERRGHRLLRDAQGEARGQRVDRLDRLQAIELVRPHDEIRVGDLGSAVVELDAAADDPLGADRQQPRELVAPHIEIDQGQGPGVVGAQHPVGASSVTGLMRLDAHRDRHDLVGLEGPHRRRRAPVDDAARQVP